MASKKTTITLQLILKLQGDQTTLSAQDIITKYIKILGKNTIHSPKITETKLDIYPSKKHDNLRHINAVKKITREILEKSKFIKNRDFEYKLRGFNDDINTIIETHVISESHKCDIIAKIIFIYASKLSEVIIEIHRIKHHSVINQRTFKLANPQVFSNIANYIDKAVDELNIIEILKET